MRSPIVVLLQEKCDHFAESDSRPSPLLLLRCGEPRKDDHHTSGEGGGE
jgi:hypothetical protein